jgi:hypothetical protein
MKVTEFINSDVAYIQAKFGAVEKVQIFKNKLLP